MVINNRHQKIFSWLLDVQRANSRGHVFCTYEWCVFFTKAAIFQFDFLLHNWLLIALLPEQLINIFYFIIFNFNISIKCLTAIKLLALILYISLTQILAFFIKIWALRFFILLDPINNEHYDIDHNNTLGDSGCGLECQHKLLQKRILVPVWHVEDV